MNTETTAEAYNAKLLAMTCALNVWRSENPKRHVVVLWNYPGNTVVCATLSDALEMRLIKVNQDALDMFRELGWLEDNADQPSVLMVRVVMEANR